MTGGSITISFGCSKTVTNNIDTSSTWKRNGGTKKMNSNNEMVEHPSHYGGENNPYEVIKVCEEWGLDKDAYLFNVVKYVARAGKKDVLKEVEDLKKAMFYLDRKIKNLENY